MKTKLLIVLIALCACAWAIAQAEDVQGEDSNRSIDPGKPDVVSLDSIQAKLGQSFEMGVSVIIDASTSFNNKTWEGIGSFCIPVKYNSKAIKIDSVRFKNTVLEWDERFTNKNIDSGFISFDGIYTLSGSNKPPLFSPKDPMEIARIYMRIRPDAKPGIYKFEQTNDPLQGDMYFGSTDGYHSWMPRYIPGKVVIIK